jgi:hypothetical protein
MKIKTFLIGLIGFFLLTSCEPEPPRLPDETKEGLGTFGCLVNGELVVVWGTTWGYAGPYREIPRGYYNSTTKQFRLEARTMYGNQFYFYASEPKLGQCTIDSVFFWSFEMSHYYVARDIQQIHFTKFSNNIASGTFVFEANAYDRATNELIPNQKIQVNKGRFDVKY